MGNRTGVARLSLRFPMGGAEGPRLAVAPAAVEGAGEQWRITWRLENQGSRTVRVVGTWLPHGRFRAPDRAHELTLAPGAAASFHVDVRCAEPAGGVVENVFIILRLVLDGEPWRVLARLTVRVDPAGVPRPAVEVVTSQRAGFSGVIEEGEGDAAERA